MSAVLTTEIYFPGERLCKEGDDGDCAYILYDGIVSVYKNQKYIINFRSGELFGTQALDNKIKRTATLVAKTKCYVLLLSKKDYKNIVGKFVMHEKSNHFDFLCSLTIFKKMENFKLRNICSMINAKFYEKNAVIYKRNEEITNIYIIKRGMCCQYTTVEVYLTNKWPNSTNSWTEKKIKQVYEHPELLEAGIPLGLIDIFQGNSKYSHTVKTTEESFIFAINKENLLNQFENTEEFKVFFKKYIDEELQKYKQIQQTVYNELKFRQRSKNILSQKLTTLNEVSEHLVDGIIKNNTAQNKKIQLLVDNSIQKQQLKMLLHLFLSYQFKFFLIISILINFLKALWVFPQECVFQSLTTLLISVNQPFFLHILSYPFFLIIQLLHQLNFDLLYACLICQIAYPYLKHQGASQHATQSMLVFPHECLLQRILLFSHILRLLNSINHLGFGKQFQYTLQNLKIYFEFPLVDRPKCMLALQTFLQGLQFYELSFEDTALQLEILQDLTLKNYAMQYPTLAQNEQKSFLLQPQKKSELFSIQNTYLNLKLRLMIYNTSYFLH